MFKKVVWWFLAAYFFAFVGGTVAGLFLYGDPYNTGRTAGQALAVVFGIELMLLPWLLLWGLILLIRRSRAKIRAEVAQ